MQDKDFIVVVQCDLVMQRCSGYFCEKAFTERTGGFAAYPKDQAYRTLYLTCGGCCGRPLHRKLTNLINLRKRENSGKERIVVQLASCITKDNYHGPPCPHLDYLKTLITRLGVDFREHTTVSTKSEERRASGVYRAS